MEEPTNKNTLQDKEILELLDTVPKEGFRLLFDTYYMRLCLYAVKLTDSFELAEDTVQDFFTDLWEKQYYKGIRQNLRQYLYLSVRNSALSALQKNRMVSMEEIANCEFFPPEDLAEEEMEERRKRLVREMQKLSHQEQEAIKTVIMESKRYKEAAEELHISINTLKTYLSRGLKHLRREYKLTSLFIFLSLSAAVCRLFA